MISYKVTQDILIKHALLQEYYRRHASNRRSQAPLWWTWRKLERLWLLMGVGIIGGNETLVATNASETKAPVTGTPRTNDGQTTIINNTIYSVQSEEVVSPRG